jgi:hypothetical protein
MAVPEQRFEALGKTWRFALDFYAICSLEELYDLAFIQIMLSFLPELALKDLSEEQVLQARSTSRMTDLRKLMSAGLSSHHPEATVRDVCAIVDELGVVKVGEMLKRALAGSMGGAGTGTENPPT